MQTFEMGKPNMGILAEIAVAGSLTLAAAGVWVGVANAGDSYINNLTQPQCVAMQRQALAQNINPNVRVECEEDGAANAWSLHTYDYLDGLAQPKDSTVPSVLGAFGANMLQAGVDAATGSAG